MEEFKNEKQVCAFCGRLIHESDSVYDESDGEEYCQSCYERHHQNGIRRYGYKPSPVFYGQSKVFDYTDMNGKRHYKSVTASTKAEALRLVAEIISDREDAKEVKQNPTVEYAIEQYIEVRSNILSPSTIVGYRQILRNDLKPIMKIPVNKLTTQSVQTAINLEAKNHSPKSVRNMYALLMSAVHVYEPKFTPEIILPRKIKPDIEIPTKEEIGKLFEYIEGSKIEIPVHLAAVCGMRRGEICALTWEDIDLEKGTISINKALSDTPEKGVGYVVKSTKTTAGKRIIRPPKHVMELLKDADRNTGRITKMDPCTLYKNYSKALESCGCPHYKFHALRHYAVSVMLSLNIPKNYIADFMGHETENMIDQVYGHVMKDKRQEFEDRIDGFYSGKKY